jgi:hypothetical protein
MRKVCVKIYKYDELSDSAKEKARQWWIGCESQDHAWAKENRETLDVFCALFPVKVSDWEYGYQNYINFSMTCNDEIETLSGWRLATYLWNNYRRDLYKGKYYSTSGKCIDGKYHYKSRHSRIILDNCCVLTGYCIDDDILKPIYDFLNRPDSQTFYDLMNDCLQSWVYACRDEYEHALSDESAEDAIRANEYEFTKDGSIY